MRAQVMIDKQLLNSVLADLVLLHSKFLACALLHYAFASEPLYHPWLQLDPSSRGLALPCADMNVRLVLVLGVRLQMDGLLAARGVARQYVDGYRVTDMEVMTAAAEATGAARVEVEAALSKVRTEAVQGVGRPAWALVRVVSPCRAAGKVRSPAAIRCIG